MKICVRCKEPFGLGPKCRECGVKHDRPVRRCRRSRKAGCKRGRNSGTTNTAKNK